MALRAVSGAVAELEFLWRGEVFLNVRASVNGPEETARVTIAEGDRRLAWMVNAKRYDETHRVFVTGWDQGYPFTGSYDLRGGSPTVGASFVSWLLPESLERMAEVHGELQALNEQLAELRAPYDDDIRELIDHSRFRDHLEASCWALGAALGGWGGDLGQIHIPHHYVELAKLTLLAASGYAAAMCAKIWQERGSGS